MLVGVIKAEQVPYLVRYSCLEVVASDARDEDAEEEEGWDEDG